MQWKSRKNLVKGMKNKENLELLAEKICQADAVVIGGGSGLSSAAGYNHYRWMSYQEERLPRVQRSVWFSNEDVFYISMNQEESSSPEHLKSKSLYANGELSETLQNLKQIMKRKAGA